MTSDLTPSRKWKEVFAWVRKEIEALPYRPSTRWAFYRALGRFQLDKKDWRHFKQNLAYRRKRFSEGWRPDSLVDSVRRVHSAGHGPNTEQEFREQLLESSP